MEISIRDLIKELGLPEESIFLGNIIHLPEEDEFLMYIDEKGKIFSRFPGKAKRYETYKEAKADTVKCNRKAEVWFLFDVLNDYIIAPVE